MITVVVVTEAKGSKESEKTRVELDSDAPTLRDLIAAKVRVEVSEWRTRSRRLFGREWVTENDVKFQRGPGEVRVLGRWEAPPVDEEREVKKAIDAYGRDRYHVYFAEKRALKLDERVPGDRLIRFVRLSAVPGA